MNFILSKRIRGIVFRFKYSRTKVERVLVWSGLALDSWCFYVTTTVLCRCQLWKRWLIDHRITRGFRGPRHGYRGNKKRNSDEYNLSTGIIFEGGEGGTKGPCPASLIKIMRSLGWKYLQFDIEGLLCVHSSLLSFFFYKSFFPCLWRSKWKCEEMEREKLIPPLRFLLFIIKHLEFYFEIVCDHE